MPASILPPPALLPAALKNVTAGALAAPPGGPSPSAGQSAPFDPRLAERHLAENAKEALLVGGRIERASTSKRALQTLLAHPSIDDLSPRLPTFWSAFHAGLRRHIATAESLDVPFDGPLAKAIALLDILRAERLIASHQATELVADWARRKADSVARVVSELDQAPEDLRSATLERVAEALAAQLARLHLLAKQRPLFEDMQALARSAVFEELCPAVRTSLTVRFPRWLTALTHKDETETHRALGEMSAAMNDVVTALAPALSTAEQELGVVGRDTRIERYELQNAAHELIDSPILSLLSNASGRRDAHQRREAALSNKYQRQMALVADATALLSHLRTRGAR